MPKILYGVMGDARGHVNHALVVAREMPEHEFLFLGGGNVSLLGDAGYNFEIIPMPGTLYKNNTVDIVATIRNAIKVFGSKYSATRRVMEIIQSFDPDLILTDYEYFTPIAAEKLGRQAVSLDRQHVITHCVYTDPPEEKLSRMMTSAPVKWLFSRATHYIILSFCNLSVKRPDLAEVVPPLIRREIIESTPGDGGHALVYQTSPTFHRLFPLLQRLDRKFIIYGFGKRSQQKNLIFKEFSNQGFVEDLASCRYAITNGGHNVVSEALFLHKPVFSFPIKNAYEQYINSYFLKEAGFGSYSISHEPNYQDLLKFESEIDIYTKNIQRHNFFGNKIVVSKIRRFIDQD